MQQGQHYHRFGYQPFSDSSSPQAPSPQGFDRPGYEGQGASFDEGAARQGGGIAAFVSSPLVMTGALICAAVVFAGILMASYPSSDDIPQPIPIVQADSAPLKSSPADAGGMEIANSDTTVFEAVDGASKPVENLLEAAPPAEEQPMSKQEVLAKLKTQESPEESAEAAPAPEVAIAEVTDAPAEPAQTALAPKVAIPLPRPEKAAAEKPMHEPGASPDTIAFVRSVLDQKDVKTAAAAPKPQEIFEPATGGVAVAPTPAPAAAPVTPVAQAPALVPQAIEPAAGSPAVAPVPTPTSAPASTAGGTHYVQIVSVPTREAAQAEWSKIQKTMASVLSGAPHRIQEANLGEKGTYYRVQLGPYSEAAARSLCDQVKSQKPGGCFVVR